MKRKTLLLIVLLSVLALVLTSCSGQSKEAKAVAKARETADAYVRNLEKVDVGNKLSLIRSSEPISEGHYTDEEIESISDALFSALSANAAWKFKMADIHDDSMRLYYDVKLPTVALLMQRYEQATSSGDLSKTDDAAIKKFFADQTFAEEELKQIVVYADMIKKNNEWEVVDGEETLKQAFINNTSAEINYDTILSNR